MRTDSAPLAGHQVPLAVHAHRPEVSGPSATTPSQPRGHAALGARRWRGRREGERSGRSDGRRMERAFNRPVRLGLRAGTRLAPLWPARRPRPRFPARPPRGRARVRGDLRRVAGRRRLHRRLRPEGHRGALRGPRDPQTSFLQRLRPTSRTFRPLLPLYPHAIESLDLRGYDVVDLVLERLGARRAGRSRRRPRLLLPQPVPLRLVASARRRCAARNAADPARRCALLLYALAPVGLDRRPARRRLRRQLGRHRRARSGATSGASRRSCTRRSSSRASRPGPVGDALPGAGRADGAQAHRRRRARLQRARAAAGRRRRRAGVRGGCGGWPGRPCGFTGRLSDGEVADLLRSRAGARRDRRGGVRDRRRRVAGLGAARDRAAARAACCESVTRGRDRRVLRRRRRPGGARGGGRGPSTSAGGRPGATAWRRRRRFGVDRFQDQLRRDRRPRRSRRSGRRAPQSGPPSAACCQRRSASTARRGIHEDSLKSSRQRATISVTPWHDTGCLLCAAASARARICPLRSQA